jgi:hypothetical protein
MFEQICKSRLDDVRAGDMTPVNISPQVNFDTVARAISVAKNSTESANDHVARIIVDAFGKKMRFADVKILFETSAGSVSVTTNDEEITITINRDAISDSNLIKLMPEFGSFISIEPKTVVLKLTKRDFSRAAKIVNMLIGYVDCD